MPDITMCKGKEKEGLCLSCYRKRATPSEYRQAWFTEIPGKMVNEVFTCSFFDLLYKKGEEKR